MPPRPFYIRGKGWVPARELQHGDLLLSDDGQWVEVDRLQESRSYVKVYNLRISDWHTYFVGSQEWDFSVRAHNTNGLCGVGQGCQTAVEAADAALAAGKDYGAAAQLTINGKIFTDISGAKTGLNPALQSAIEAIPPGSTFKWTGQCAEVGCLNQALNAGVNPAGGTSIAVNIGNTGFGHGTFKEACPSCQFLLTYFGVKF